MRIWCDTANLDEIREWDQHPWVSGFTTNPTLIKTSGTKIQDLINTTKKDISIDGLDSGYYSYSPHVLQKLCVLVAGSMPERRMRTNWTAVCSVMQVRRIIPSPGDVISVFAGRIMDTGRDPQPVIDAAKQTGVQVLWASVREPYNITQAEQAGCDIVTVSPAILTKWLAWNGKPLEVVAAETIAQFDRDREGMWT